MLDLKAFIRDIPDFPKPGIVFKDITPLLADPIAFRNAIDRIGVHFDGREIDAIAAAEARGFLFAAPLALRLHKPLVPLRKPGKLPYRTYSLKYELEYGHAELQMHADGVTHGGRVLLIDDVLATGGTVEAGARLVTQAGGKVVACAFLVELSFLKGREKLMDFEVYSLITY
ncbi:MAG TPA: adenine phosphoribosyltransferase [Gemmataceae bacterium]|jgi:adenine phosphoribosyltransferase|nr:adenine phosphoribosyltransferase [Gemmataceae bacterium]